MGIEKWVNYIANHKVKAFWIALLVMIVAAMGMRPSSSCLITTSTPKAIVDLELAFDQEEALRIKKLWSSNGCGNSLAFGSNGLEAAVVNTFLDFPFLLSYTVFLIVLVALTQKRSSSNGGATTILVSAALLAGILDIVENILMLIFLKIHEIPSYTFAIAASLKFGILLLLIMVIIWRLIRVLIASKE